MSFADTVFFGGPVFTGTGTPQHGLAVAVTGTRITACVPEAEVAAMIGEHTRVIDLQRALLSPGFQDAHVHPTSAGVELLTCNLSEATDAADAVRTVAKYADENPDVPWILGGGWSMDHFPGGAPTRDLLDSVVGDRPVLLLSRDHHSSWASTAALRLAGIDSNTPDPGDGRIEREADGTPAGTFHEGAMDLFNGARPIISDDLAYAGLLRAQGELIALGITGWQDAYIGGGIGGVRDVRSLYLRALEEGTLRAHVTGAQWWERTAGREQIPEMTRRRDELIERGQDSRFSLGTVKIMVDGVAENHTAAMVAPYRDEHGHDTDNRGLSFIDPERLNEYVTELDAAGLQVHFHALGDRAVREALDALEAAHAANGETDGRHHLAHLQVIEESDIARFAAVNAVANIQALWACHEDQLDELTLPFLQEGAEARQYPFGDLARSNTRFAAGSDWPVSSANPIEAIHIAVNRVVPGETDAPLGGEQQQLDLDTAMAAYTSGSAYVNHRDHDTGYIREGYLANLVVLNPNPFELSAADIYTTEVNSTWIEGESVYSRGA